MVFEHGARTAGSVVEALKGNPCVLAVIVLFAMFIGYQFYHDRDIHNVLSRCVSIEDYEKLSRALQKPYYDRKELDGARQ